MGLRKQQIGIGPALAFFLGNPVLNPATLLFIGFVLGWQFTAIRIVFGILLVFGVAAWAARLGDRIAPQRRVPVEFSLSPIEEPGRSWTYVLRTWLRELWVEAYQILPGYALIVLIIGALRAWFFPPEVTIHAASLPAIAALSVLGTLFVIPTAGEVPIVQTLMQHGMSVGPAVALLLTLPAISLPSLYIVRNVFPKRILAFATACVCAAGIVGGIAAGAFLH